jgi:hypothetical protein
MPTRTVIALSVSAIFYANCAEAALARQPVSTSSDTSHSQLEPCHPPDVGSPSPSSDFVAIPYTFGDTLEYRPAWIAGMQARAGGSRKMTKRPAAPSLVPDC